MRQDARGLAVSTDSADAVAALDRATHALLAHRADLPTHLTAALEADANFALAHILTGFALRIAVRGELVPAAGRHLAAARAALAQRGGTAREADLAAALAVWHEQGDMHEAADRLERVLLRHPRDAMALKLAHAIRFMLGDAAGMRLATATALPAWHANVPGHGFVLGCHAFGLEETGDPDAAEPVGRQAVAQEPADLWGAHAVAHVMESQGRAREGITWLAALDDRTAAAGPFGRHVHWHRALFHLHLGETESALELYDRRVRDASSEDARDFANAASLLWRLEAQGVDVGAARWQALADLATRRVDECALAFTDLHHVLALAAAGESGPLRAKLGAMHGRALRDADTQARIVAQAGLPAARAIAAAESGDPREAVELLLPLRHCMRRLGGSHAQRDLLDRLLIDACLAAGRDATAAELLEQRIARRAPGAWEESRLLRLHRGTGRRAARARLAVIRLPTAPPGAPSLPDQAAAPPRRGSGRS